MLLGDGSSVAYALHATEELSPCGIPSTYILKDEMFKHPAFNIDKLYPHLLLLSTLLVFTKYQPDKAQISKNTPIII
jgi:hypothetical protein